MWHIWGREKMHAVLMGKYEGKRPPDKEWRIILKYILKKWNAGQGLH
jgi:hypothetical protein